MQETQQGDMFTHIALKWSLNFQNEVYMEEGVGNHDHSRTDSQIAARL